MPMSKVEQGIRLSHQEIESATPHLANTLQVIFEARQALFDAQSLDASDVLQQAGNHLDEASLALSGANAIIPRYKEHLRNCMLSLGAELDNAPREMSTPSAGYGGMAPPSSEDNQERRAPYQFTSSALQEIMASRVAISSALYKATGSRPRLISMEALAILQTIHVKMQGEEVFSSHQICEVTGLEGDGTIRILYRLEKDGMLAGESSLPGEYPGQPRRTYATTELGKEICDLLPSQPLQQLTDEKLKVTELLHREGLQRRPKGVSLQTVVVLHSMSRFLKHEGSVSVPQVKEDTGYRPVSVARTLEDLEKDGVLMSRVVPERSSTETNRFYYLTHLGKKVLDRLG